MSALDHRSSCGHFPRRDRTDAHWAARLATIPALPAPGARTPVKRWSFHLPMRDGNRIALDVHVPAALESSGARLPTMLRQTRYYRSLGFTPRGLRWISPDLLEGEATTRARFLEAGYAWVDVDARGSGASYGVRPHPWSRDEVADGGEVVSWIVAQPWSNGRVGSTGVSYEGTTAEFLGTLGHPAVRAIAPRFSLYDVYTDIAFPGGLQLAWFTRNWSRYNRSLDGGRFDDALGGTLRLFAHAVRDSAAIADWARRLAALVDTDLAEAVLRALARRLITGVRPVDADADRQLLAAAIASHAGNHDPHADALTLTYRDDAPPGRPAFTPDAFSPHSSVTAARSAGIPIASISGWHDSAYPHSAVKRFRAVGTPGSRLILGPWEHGGALHTSPRGATRVTSFDAVGELLRFFDLHLRGIDDGIGGEPPVHYFLMGEERWRAAPSWPPPEAVETRLFLGDERTLLEDAPPSLDRHDVYRVDATAGTGARARWDSLIGFHHTIDYPDRASADRKLLTYDSAPLARAVAIAGHPLVTLWTASSAPDAAVFAYLEDVDERGQVTYVTEGLLRALHRRTVDEAPPYPMASPYRTFRREHGAAARPGEPMELVFELLPVAYRFEGGHSIRLAIAGADADHFAPLAGAPPELHVLRGPRFPSALTLPVLPGA